MGIFVIPSWIVPGADPPRLAGPLNYPSCQSMAEAQRWIDEGLNAARRAGGINARVVLVDDLTMAKLAIIRPGRHSK